MKEIIYLLGIDGSGKTTQAHNLLEYLRKKGLKANYLYARYFPFLSMPLKLMSKLFIYKKDSEFGNFERYSVKKTNFSKKHTLLAKFYIIICLIDYIIISLPRVYYKYFTSRIIVVDRYLIDFVTTLTIAAGLSVEESLKLFRVLQRIFPKASYCFFINIDINTAFSRKNDIPSKIYLEDRMKYYKKFIEGFNFYHIDGGQKPEDVTNSLISKLRF